MGRQNVYGFRSEHNDDSSTCRTMPFTGKGDGGVYGCLAGVWIERIKVADLSVGHAAWRQGVDPGREPGADADLGVAGVNRLGGLETSRQFGGGTGGGDAAAPDSHRALYWPYRTVPLAT
jgi:hypothetical protein